MRLVIIAVVAVTLIGVGALMFFKDKTYILSFTEAELHERLDEKLPFSEDYLFIFNVTLENPRVDLIEGSDRIAGGLDAILNVKLGDSDVPVGGALDVSGNVRYAPEEGAFYLANPQIDKVRLQGVPERFANRANNALSLAIAEFYRERPIYRLSESDVKHAAAKMVLRDVNVKDEVLYVTLGLAKEEE